MKQEATLYKYLHTYFHYNQFKEGQKEIILDILRGNDVLGVLRTGSGKSLCYQLPAKILPGTTIVVSPLISLMIDQVRQVKAYHYKEVVALHSFQNRYERNRILNQLNDYKLVYVSPELLQQKQVIQNLKNSEIRLFVIDEAHCISQWGYDFRPDYLRLAEIIQLLNTPPVLALTGTASPEVQNDIIEKLGKKQMKRYIYPMDRKNISLIVHQIKDSDKEKIDFLSSFISKSNQPTIIYFSSRKTSEYIASTLAEQNPQRNISYYHGGMDQEDRLKIQQQFINDQLDVICCTSAFGMGINKQNIRFVIHYHLPTELESYIQEIGRAGRDGKDSVSILLYRKNDEQIPLQIIENELPTEQEIVFVMKQLFQLNQENKTIPMEDEMKAELFQVDSTKWRFLHYHFESHGMIKENQIIYHKTKWQHAYISINQFCEERRKLKLQRLNNIVRWLQSKHCLREELYKNFQPYIQKNPTKCCSNCGYSLEELEHHLKPKENKISLVPWQKQLMDILLIGE